MLLAMTKHEQHNYTQQLRQMREQKTAPKNIRQKIQDYPERAVSVKCAMQRMRKDRQRVRPMTLHEACTTPELRPERKKCKN